MTIGERIKKIRLEKGMTQKEIAESIGIATNSFSRYEIGEREPNLEMINRIANALNVSPIQLIFNENTNDFLKKIGEKAIEMTDFYNENNIAIPDEENIFLSNKYNILNKKGKKEANNYINYLSTQDEYTAPDKDDE